ncbi:MAG: hypothetical protein PHZ00_08050 [Candidatus Peribacteraceae bacterium]|nr:hypothetical protein [Candidatus Peribacteraceae bacterium]
MTQSTEKLQAFAQPEAKDFLDPAAENEIIAQTEAAIDKLDV